MRERSLETPSSGTSRPYGDTMDGPRPPGSTIGEGRFAALDRAAGGSCTDGRKVLLVCSSGGHLAQLLELAPWLAGKQRKWVTFDLPDAHTRLEGEDVVFAHYPTTRSIPNLARNAVLAQRLLRTYRPHVVISNGAGVAFPFFAFARRFGARTCYLEVYDRINSRTMSGRLCHRFSDLFLVQWREQQALYPGSVYVGGIY